MSRKKDLHPENEETENFKQTNDSPAGESSTGDGAPSSSEDKESSLKKELEELHDKYLRLYSEFDNYKRRNSRERIELLQTAGKEIILAMLPVLDDFERADKSINTSNDIQAIKDGLNLVQNKLRSILNQKGLKAMESIGQEFNVDFHEAITKVPAPSEDLKGKVVDELEKGYTLNDKVIRFAKVVIGE